MAQIESARIWQHIARFSMPARSHLKNLHHSTLETLKWRDSEVSAWHGLFFMLSIGVAPLVGLLFGQERAGIAGGVVGLLLSLSDSAESLRCRLLLLLRATLLVLFCGFVGAQFKGYSLAFWAFFTVLSLGTGYFSLIGNVRASALRYGALALITTAGVPGANLQLTLMVVLTAAVVALTRVASQLLIPGAAPVLPVALRREAPPGFAGWRYCVCYVGAAAAGLVIGETTGILRPVWLATTVLLVMQPDPISSYQRIAQRIFGTGVGVLLATLIVGVFHSVWLLFFVILLIAFFVPHGASRNYWLLSALAATLVLVLYDYGAMGHHFDVRLLLERMRDVFFGCLLALGATALSFPPRLKLKSG